jgi:AcrR family transcriptional regulator
LSTGAAGRGAWEIANPMRAAKPARAGDLTRDAIIETAQALIGAAGVEAMSMRQLATELNVTATALYYHIGSKDALLDEVFCRLLRSVEPHDKEQPWTTALEDLLVHLQYLASSYPGMQKHMADHLDSGATLTWIEMILRVLKDGGFDDQDAATVMSVVGFYNSPMPLRGQAAVRSDPWEPVSPQAIGARMAQSPELYPNLAQAIRFMRPPDEALFRLGLRTLIEGLEARLHAQRKKNPAAETAAGDDGPGGAARQKS